MQQLPEIPAATVAAIWSAVAASLSALSAFLVMRIQRRNLLESVRPEIVLTGWGRQTKGAGDSAHDVITVQILRNVGRGPALSVVVNATGTFRENRPTYGMSTVYLPIVAPNETVDINSEIGVWWKNVAAVEGDDRYVGLRVRIHCWDSRGMRHETRYTAVASQRTHHVVMANAVAPGLMLSTRVTVTRSVRLLKFVGLFRRVPLLGRVSRRVLGETNDE